MQSVLAVNLEILKIFIIHMIFLKKINKTMIRLSVLFLDQGNSYPKALSLAFQTLEPNENIIDLSLPNNILGFQYVNAAQKQQLKTKMITIPRKNANYHDEHFSTTLHCKCNKHSKSTIFS